MNIIDYLKINGHKTFDELKFNEVDGLIFAQLAYLSYGNMCTSFNDVIDSKNLNAYETSILLSKNNHANVKNNQDLIREVLSSNRYREVKFGHYLNLHDEKVYKQFSAITFIFKDFICISYMGTDDTILGWKEDFGLSYLKHVPSQIEGKKYLENIASIYDLPIILTGHSKGGNIAIYSMCNSSKNVRKRVLRSYSYDSPGFNKEFINSNNYLANKDKMNIYLPESSFIGLIMYEGDNYKIVSSDKLFFYQHNTYNWLVNDTNLSLTDKLSKKSLAFSESNREWIENFNNDERKIFFDTIFDLLEYKDNKSFSTIKDNWKNEISRIIESSKNISEENKKLMIKIFKNMFTTYLRYLFEKNK